MVQEFKVSGDLTTITAAIAALELPKSWGNAKLLKSWATDHVPLGKGWHGVIRIAGYRTPPGEDGTGTVYVNVSWKPCNGAHQEHE